MRSRPARSVTSMSPFGSHVMPHGCDSSRATIDDADLVLFGRVEDHGPGGQRHLGDANGEPAAPSALLREAGGH